MKRGLLWLSIAAVGVAAILVLHFAFDIFRPARFPADAVFVPRDVSTLEEALEEAEAGETIVLQAESETHQGSFRIDTQDLTLLAEREGVRITGAGEEPALRIAAEGVTVSGLHISSESIGVRVEAGGCRLEGLTVEDAPIGIQLAGVRRATLRDLDLSVGLTGIELVASSGNRIEFVSVTGGTATGIRLVQSEENLLESVSVLGSGAGISLDQASNANTLSSIVVEGASSAGLEIRASNDNVLTDCTITEAEVGVRIMMATGNTLRGGSVSEMSAAGVAFEQAARNRVDGLSVLDCGGDGLRFEQSGENTVVYNDILRCRGAGVLLSASSRNLLLENRLEACSIGFDLDEADENRILRNRLEEVSEVGILVRSSDGNRLLDNEIGPAALGVVLVGGEENVLRRNCLADLDIGGFTILADSDAAELTDNLVQESGFGLLVSGSGYANVIGNVFEDGRIGIRLVDVLEGILLEENRLSGNDVGLEFGEMDEDFVALSASLRADGPVAEGRIASPRMSGNAFERSLEFDILNETEQPIYAAGNWWGDGTESYDSARVRGNVLLERSAWNGMLAVGADDTGIQRILGRILQVELERAGYRVIDLIGIGNGGRSADALRARDVDLIWWTEGSIDVDGEAHVLDTPARMGWAALASPALVERLISPSIDAVTTLTQTESEPIRFAAPQAFGAESFTALTAAYGLQGGAASITWARTQNEAEALAKFGAVDIALVESLEETLSSSGFAVLSDDREALESSTLSVVLRRDALSRHPEIEDLLTELASRLTTDVLHGLSGRVRMLDRSPEEVVREFFETTANAS